MTVTPRCTCIFPGRVASQLPPASAARSTMTDPCFIAATIWELNSVQLLQGDSANTYLVSNQFRCRFAWDKGGRDDNVNFLRLSHEKCLWHYFRQLDDL